MDDKITIIEGPPPVFERVHNEWALGLNEGPQVFETMQTRLRTYNGAALVERCHRTWNARGSMYLHFRNDLGLEDRVPIVAARATDSPEGQVLLLWVRLNPSEVEYQIHDDDENGDDPS